MDYKGKKTKCRSACEDQVCQKKYLSNIYWVYFTYFIFYANAIYKYQIQVTNATNWESIPDYQNFSKKIFLSRWTLFLWPHPPIQIGRLSPTGKDKYKYKYAKIQIHKYLPSKSESSRLQEKIMIFFSQETLIFLCVYLDNQQGGVLHQNKASDQ